MRETNLNPAGIADWCEQNMGRTVFYGSDQGTLSGYSPSDGRCYVTVELDDGSTAEWLADDLADVY